jgi:hypothetical protein
MEEAMSLKPVALIGLFLFVLATTAAGQDVVERDDGIYSTDDIIVGRSIDSNAQIKIASASYLSGELTIKTADTAAMRITYRKVAKAADRSQAIDFIDLISVVVSGRPEAPEIKLRSPNPAPWSGTDYSGRVEAELVVPVGSEILIEATMFDVTVIGPLKGLEIPESLGRIDVQHITERLNVVTANRRVTVYDISGDISISTTNSSIIAESLNAGTGQARFRNEGGDIRVENLIGSVNARNRFGRITLEDFEPRGEGSFIRGGSGPVLVDIRQMSEGQLVITNRQEDIEIIVPDSLSAFYTLSVGEDGLIEAGNFSFTPDLVQRDRLSLQSGDGDVDIRGSIKGKGNIYVRGRSGD